MFKKEELHQMPEYWLEKIQNELFREIETYRKEKGLTRTELAKEFGVSKGYISQVLNGNFNHTLKKMIELSLAIGKVPMVSFEATEDLLKRETAAQSSPPVHAKVSRKSGKVKQISRLKRYPLEKPMRILADSGTLTWHSPSGQSSPTDLEPLSLS